MKKRTILCSLLLAFCLTLSGCGVTDSLYYLFGSDKVVSKGEQYVSFDSDLGITLVYDSDVWEEPVFPQEDTIGLMAGNSINYTALLFQMTDDYTDFVSQSVEELKAETKVVESPYELEIPNASMKGINCDCGSYQTLFLEVTYDSGETVYITAATYSGSLDKIEKTIRMAHPTGQMPEEARELLEK